MTPCNRVLVLVLVGGVAIIASLTIAVIFVQTNTSGAKLQTDEAAVHRPQALGDQLLTEDHEQREALDEYLMSADPLPLARYRQAVTDETQTKGQIRAGAGDLSGVVDSLASVAAENDAWRATVAEPAIAAIRSGSLEAVKAATQAEIQDQEATQAAAGQFVIKLTPLGPEAIDAALRALLASRSLQDHAVTPAVGGPVLHRVPRRLPAGLTSPGLQPPREVAP